jgi:hypothetical protein
LVRGALRAAHVVSVLRANTLDKKEQRQTPCARRVRLGPILPWGALRPLPALVTPGTRVTEGRAHCAQPEPSRP